MVPLDRPEHQNFDNFAMQEVPSMIVRHTHFVTLRSSKFPAAKKEISVWFNHDRTQGSIFKLQHYFD